MARQLTWGFELNLPTASATSGHPEGNFNSSQGAELTVIRPGSGAVSLRFNNGAGNTAAFAKRDDQTPTASATNYFRGYFCFAAKPAVGSDATILRTSDATPRSQISVRYNNGKTIELWNDSAGTQIGVDSEAIVVDDAKTWYRIELSVTTNASAQITACELRLNGATIASTSGLTLAYTAASFSWDYGWVTAPGGASKIGYVDDCAINDSTGGSQNSWPGEGHIVLLVPTADSAKGLGWTNDAGGATNFWDATDNKPPAGTTDTTVGSGVQQIRNATANANSSYDATMTTYVAAGVPFGAAVTVIQPICETGAPVATSAKAGTVGVVSNPTIANVALAVGGTSGAFWSGVTAGAYPTGWKWSEGTVTYAPNVTLGTAPVMRITQVTSSTRIAMVCFLGMYVEYSAPQRPPMELLQAVNRAAVI